MTNTLFNCIFDFHCITRQFAIIRPRCTFLWAWSVGTERAYPLTSITARIDFNFLALLMATLHVSSTHRLKVKDPTLWNHHRGGWTYAVRLIQENLHDQDGTLCISSVEDYVLDEEEINEPWVGFVHQVPKTTLKWFPDLQRLLQSDHLKNKMLPTCKGLFVLSSVVKEYLTTNWPTEFPQVPIAKIWYPATPGWRPFSMDSYNQSNPKKVLFIGEYMRNYKAFNDLQLPLGYAKVLLKPPDVNFSQMGITINQDIEVKEHVSDDEYDTLLQESVVFLNLVDAPANTTIIECLMRGCPIVVNRLQGLEEYLLREYPLFYEKQDLDQAARMITSHQSLAQAIQFMEEDCKSIKDQLTPKAFLGQLQNSAIFRSLPIPRSEQKLPLQQSFSVTVVICSYKRIHNMKGLFQRLVDQELENGQTFEVILWNNNFHAREELKQIAEPFVGSLNMKQIDSSENFYCIIRLAVVHLMRSNFMLICDDDVIPKPKFISRFLQKYDQYGGNVVLGCRGHTFERHDLDEEEPQLCWEDYENLHFHSEEEDDTQVHFLHADTCLIPRHILLQSMKYDLPYPEVILVDDYWLSFVFSHHLGVNIWKIKGDDIVQQTDDANDQSVALCQNPAVHEQRIRFYIYHMRQGWPNSVIAPNH